MKHTIIINEKINTRIFQTKAATTVPLFIEFSNIDFSFSLSGTYNFTEFRK